MATDLHPSRPTGPATVRPPVVLVPACNKRRADHPTHTVGAKYIDAVRLAGALPVVVPHADTAVLDHWLELADGVMLTGSVSNVHPSHFDEAVHDETLPLDPLRDDWVLPLIPRAVARGLPLLAICRGAQEVNVAYGGSLHQAVHSADGHADHRARDADPVDVQYGPAHAVQVRAGGLLERITGLSRFDVNSLHGQAVKRLAPGLCVEATAPDGVIEAFSIESAPGFALAVQWHPEWRAEANPVSRALFAAFGRALCNYRDRVRGPLPG